MTNNLLPILTWEEVVVNMIGNPSKFSDASMEFFLQKLNNLIDNLERLKIELRDEY